MCGVLGLLSLSDKYILDNIKLTESLNKLKFRGPDDIDFVNKKNIWIGHTRLSIIDLKTGKQPMISNCGRYVISFNGEIYNYKILKDKINYEFKTDSDTEVILAGFLQYGKIFFKELEGMFAFSIVDLEEEKIIITRDRFGIKPLLYFLDKEFFIFSSEIKSLLPFVNKKQIETKNMQEYFLRRFIPSPNTIYKNIFKLKAGEIISISKKNRVLKKENFSYQVSNYINKSNKILKKSQLINILRKSVKKHLVSDVPIGVLLSGGIDSSLITYLASTLNSKVSTFTVGIKNYKHNSDLEYARIIANNLNTNHNEILVDKISKQELIKVIKYFDEPFADTSILFYYLLSKNCSKKFKVFLSGDGADEIFYGYRSYNKIANTKSIYNKNLYKLIFNLSKFNNKFYSLLNKITHSNEEKYSIGYYGMSKVYLEKLFNTSLDFLYFPEKYNIRSLRDYDLEVNLPDYYLQKVDKISMMNSFEVRVPFLDKDILGSVNYLDKNSLFNKSDGKSILKELFNEYLPSSIINRPKQGFIRDWKYIFRDDLNELFDNYVDDNLLSMLNINKNKYLYILKSKTSINLLMQWRILVFGIWYKENFIQN